MFIDPQILTCQCLSHKCLGMELCAVLNTYIQTHEHTPQPSNLSLQRTGVEGGGRRVVPLLILPLTCTVVLGKPYFSQLCRVGVKVMSDSLISKNTASSMSIIQLDRILVWARQVLSCSDCPFIWIPHSLRTGQAAGGHGEVMEGTPTISMPAGHLAGKSRGSGH